jgi:hypothetical protein
MHIPDGYRFQEHPLSEGSHFPPIFASLKSPAVIPSASCSMSNNQSKLQIASFSESSLSMGKLRFRDTNNKG